MRQGNWLGLMLAAGLSLAGCAAGGPGTTMSTEQREAMTDDMSGSDASSSNMIGGAPGTLTAN